MVSDTILGFYSQKDLVDKKYKGQQKLQVEQHLGVSDEVKKANEMVSCIMRKMIFENKWGAFKKEFYISNVSIFDEKYQVVKGIVDANDFKLISNNINLIRVDKGIALSSSWKKKQYLDGMLQGKNWGEKAMVYELYGVS